MTVLHPCHIDMNNRFNVKREIINCSFIEEAWISMRPYTYLEILIHLLTEILSH